MKSYTPLVGATGLVLLSAVGASPLLAERAVTCEEMMPLMQSNLAAATRFCNVYLQIAPATSTAWNTVTRETDTVTTAEYTTTTLMVTPATLTRQARTTTKVSSTITPSTKTVTEQQTSTAYIDAYGSTIAMMKRQEPSQAPSKVEHAPRAIFTPSYFKGMRKTEIRTACLCLELPTPIITRNMETLATATATQTLQRTMRSTSVLPRVVETATNTITLDVIVTAAAPLATETAWNIREVQSCPPGTVSTWLCPDMTAADDGNDPNFKNCRVVSQDGYAGYCLYWADDGSPAASTLSLGDGSGDPAYDQYRAAVYGDDATDDCPRWADWTCAASTGGNARRSTLEAAAVEHSFAKRGLSPKWISLAEHKRQGRRKMPFGVRRGGKFRSTHRLTAPRKSSA